MFGDDFGFNDDAAGGTDSGGGADALLPSTMGGGGGGGGADVVPAVPAPVRWWEAYRTCFQPDVIFDVVWRWQWSTPGSRSQSIDTVKRQLKLFSDNCQWMMQPMASSVGGVLMEHARNSMEQWNESELMPTHMCLVEARDVSQTKYVWTLLPVSAWLPMPLTTDPSEWVKAKPGEWKTSVEMTMAGQTPWCYVPVRDVTSYMMHDEDEVVCRLEDNRIETSVLDGTSETDRGESTKFVTNTHTSNDGGMQGGSNMLHLKQWSTPATRVLQMAVSDLKRMLSYANVQDTDAALHIVIVEDAIDMDTVVLLHVHTSDLQVTRAFRLDPSGEMQRLDQSQWNKDDVRTSADGHDKSEDGSVASQVGQKRKEREKDAEDDVALAALNMNRAQTTVPSSSSSFARIMDIISTTSNRDVRQVFQKVRWRTLLHGCFDTGLWTKWCEALPEGSRVDVHVWNNELVEEAKTHLKCVGLCYTNMGSVHATLLQAKNSDENTWWTDTLDS